MEWFEAIILGLVQGLTEFLPVSSSGHLAIGRELLGIEASGDLVFEVTVHAATVCATIVVFRRMILDLLKGLFKFKYNAETEFILKIALSMVPVLFVGVFLKDYVEELFSSLPVVGIALLVTAALLFASDRARTAPQTEDSGEAEGYGRISWLQAFIMGLAQAVAVIPGLSRSGTTISTGLLCGVDRKTAAGFSFLMVLVPILGEAFLDIVGGDAAASTIGLLPLALGFVSAFASGLLACKLMLELVRRARLSWFALYCTIVGIIVIITQL